jgi:hypothetical protein
LAVENEAATSQWRIPGGRPLHCALYHAFVQMMAAPHAARVRERPRGGKDVPPGPAPVSVGILPQQRLGEPGTSDARFLIAAEVSLAIA